MLQSGADVAHLVDLETLHCSLSSPSHTVFLHLFSCLQNVHLSGKKSSLTCKIQQYISDKYAQDLMAEVISYFSTDVTRLILSLTKSLKTGFVWPVSLVSVSYSPIIIMLSGCPGKMQYSFVPNTSVIWNSHVGGIWGF